MGTFLVFIRKLLSCYGLWIEKEELKEPPQDEPQLLSNNSLSSDLCSIRVLWSSTNENDVPNESCWNSSEKKMKGQIYSKSMPASACSLPKKHLQFGSLIYQNEKPTGESSEGRSKADEYSLDPSIKEVTSEELSSACSQLNSLESVTVADTESGSRPVKRKKKAPKCVRKIQGYHSTHKILLVGEGNFSFSVCLARAFDSSTNMVATSLNSEEYLKSCYKSAMDNVSELHNRGCRVLHDVDATTLANHSSLKGQSFDRIIYNFPHCGDFSPTKQALRKNRSLVRLFMKNSSKMIKQDGEIHIRHKTSKAFSKWDLKGLATEAGLVLIDKAPVHLNAFKGYETKYGFESGKFSSDDNFDCYPCLTYKFALPGHPNSKVCKENMKAGNAAHHHQSHPGAPPLHHHRQRRPNHPPTKSTANTTTGSTSIATHQPDPQQTQPKHPSFHHNHEPDETPKASPAQHNRRKRVSPKITRKKIQLTDPETKAIIKARKVKEKKN